VTISDILCYRLNNQQISATLFSKPQEMVSWMGALQAQDYSMAKWALGCRLPGSTDRQIEKDFQEGKILRTHVLRPTWHFVDPRDVRWMLELTAPGIRAFARNHYANLGIDSRLLKRSKRILEKALDSTGGMARNELKKWFVRAKIDTADARFGFLLLDAELDGLICSAGRRGNQFAYGLLEQIVAPSKSLTADESLAELTKRYFTSHGPALMQDFAWWSGLPLTEIKKGLAMNGSGLISEKRMDQTYWSSSSAANQVKPLKGAYFLPGFDEYFIGYKDRSVLTDPAFAKKIMGVNGIFRPTLIRNGKITGLWKRAENKSGWEIELETFSPVSRSSFNLLSAAANNYFGFLEVNGSLVIR
jgi:hypothetical protein